MIKLLINQLFHCQPCIILISFGINKSGKCLSTRTAHRYLRPKNNPILIRQIIHWFCVRIMSKTHRCCSGLFYKFHIHPVIFRKQGTGSTYCILMTAEAIKVQIFTIQEETLFMIHREIAESCTLHHPVFQ